MQYDSLQPARLLIFVLKLCGLWSYKGAIYHSWYKVYSYMVQSAFMVTTLLIMSIDVLQTKAIDEFAEAVYITLAEVVLFIKVFNIYRIEHNIVDFLESIELHSDGQPRNNEELEMLKDRQNSFRKLRNIYFNGGIIICCMIAVYPLFLDNYKLAMPAWIPFEYRNPERYIYVHSYVAFALSFSCMASITVDLFQDFLMFKVASLMNLICLRLQSFDSKQDFEDFKKVIRFHQFAQRMVHRCQDIISIPIFAQIITCASTLCLTAYRLQKASLIAKPAEFFFIMMYGFLVLLQIFFPCLYGSEVTSSGGRLIEALYCSNWVDLPLESRKLIFIYMENLKNPIELKAGGFFFIRLQLFTKTVNNAYTLLAVLLNIQD